MKIIKIDDYQSWYVESDEEAIIIDPWLDKVCLLYTSDAADD